MRITRNKAVILASTLALLAITAVVAVVVIGNMRETAIEQKIGALLKAKINATLNPQLEFDGIDYVQPKTIVLRNARLVSPDPDAPSQSIAIFHADLVRIELGEVPRKGQPLVFESLSFEKPTVQLVWPQNGDGVVGFSDLIMRDRGADAVKVSTALRMNLVSLKDATLVMDTRQPDTQPTVIDQITTDLHIDPVQGGQYHLTLALDRAPALSAQVDAVLDVDERTLMFGDSTIEMTMSREQDHLLPQSVQALLAPYDITGDATLDLSGLLDLEAWRESELRMLLQLADGQAVFGEYQLPVERLRVLAFSRNQTLEVHRFDAGILGGEVRGDGVLHFSTGYPMDLRLGGNRIEIEQMLRPTEDEAPRFAGDAEFQLSANGPLALISTELRGEGTIDIRRGRFARVAVVSDLIDFMESGGNLTRPGQGLHADRDRAQAEFCLRGDHAYFNQFDVAGSWFALRGRGKVFFDRSLSVQVNGGPLEKVQNVLGPIGDVFGTVTDSFVAYRVDGPFDNTSIRILALGGMRGAPGDHEDDLPPWTPPLTVDAAQ